MRKSIIAILLMFSLSASANDSTKVKDTVVVVNHRIMDNIIEVLKTSTLSSAEITQFIAFIRKNSFTTVIPKQTTTSK